MHCWCCCIQYVYSTYTISTMAAVCAVYTRTTILVLPMHVAHSASDVFFTFSLLDVEWKLCTHTTNDVQTSKRTQRYTISACCWSCWYEYCRFVIFQLFFLKFDELFLHDCVLYSLSLQKYFILVRFWCWRYDKTTEQQLVSPRIFLIG